MVIKCATGGKLSNNDMLIVYSATASDTNFTCIPRVHVKVVRKGRDKVMDKVSIGIHTINWLIGEEGEGSEGLPSLLAQEGCTFYTYAN